MDGHFLNFVNFVNFWTIFGQFSRSSKKKLLFLTKKKKKLFYDFLSSKICFLNEKIFWTIFGQFFFSNCAIFCDIKVVIKNPRGVQGGLGDSMGPQGFRGDP